jgi:hypothetical protein
MQDRLALAMVLPLLGSVAIAFWKFDKFFARLATVNNKNIKATRNDAEFLNRDDKIIESLSAKRRGNPREKTLISRVIDNQAT